MTRVSVLINNILASVSVWWPFSGGDVNLKSITNSSSNNDNNNIVNSNTSVSYKSSSSLGASILFPLYIYPDPGAWDPLIQAINAYPSQRFDLVINPNSGPGADTYPDESYIAGIQKLKTFSSVRTIGYVPLGYGNRSMADVQNDINIYSGWKNYPGADISMDGIFFDEHPSDLGTKRMYLQNLKIVQKQIKNSFDKGKRMIVINPGVVAANQFYSYVDAVVSFENSFSQLYGEESVFKSHDATKSTGTPTSKEAIIIYSFTDTLRKMRELVTSLVTDKRIGYLYITARDPDKGEDPYDTFGAIWQDFAAAMDSTNVSGTS